MKKIVMLIMVAVLMLGISGQAMAAFEDGHLIRVVYSSAGINEVATDLGVITSLTAPGAPTTNFNVNNFNLSMLGGTANASNSYVVYFAIANTPNRAWVSGDPTRTTQTAGGGNYGAMVGDIHTATGAYQVAAPGSSQITYLMANADSFWTSFANGTAINSMSAYVNASSGVAPVSLADLATAGYVDQKLFYYASASGIGNKTGNEVATLRTLANGSTTLNPSAVPIPAAVYLFGSGLLGLAGIRRKMSA